jgi:integrase
MTKAFFNWSIDRFSFNIPNTVKKKHFQAGILKKKRQKRKKLSSLEIKAFLSYLPPLYKELATLQFLTASRIGEASGLQLDNINSIEGKIIISHCVIWDRRKKFVELKPYPKNGQARTCFLPLRIINDIIKL